MAKSVSALSWLTDILSKAILLVKTRVQRIHSIFDGYAIVLLGLRLTQYLVGSLQVQIYELTVFRTC